MKQTETFFQKQLETFLANYLAERMQQFRQGDAGCKELLAKKKALQQQLEQYEVFWDYEEVETQYILLLSKAIYTQALQDFCQFQKLYLK